MKAVIRLADPEETVTVDVDARDRRRLEKDAATLLGVSPQVEFMKLVGAKPQTMQAMTYWAALTRSGRAMEWAEFDARFVDADDDEEGTPEEADPTVPAP